MRIARLDLRRYGKFTDQSVTLPAAERDFHLIVGPNEAGKSTLRDAIQDLLFGIETRSRYDFLHAYGDMRLGALIEQAGSPLDFIRVKARANTLKTPDGASLPETALTPFLGQVDRVFFDQMFGLNHERLINGGKQILNASNDIGRILFQAAAGIGSLGEIRAQLEREADQLWAKRKSNDREYYRASAEFEQARTELEQATVRTKDWQEARQRVEALRADLEQARTRRQVLEQERNRLERLRRIAPTVAALREHERQLAELGDVIPLPETAGQQLAKAEQEMALAAQTLQLFEQQIAEFDERLAVLPQDPASLARTADIEALTATRQRQIHHARDMGRCEEEVRVIWQDLQDAARQLSWPATTEADLGQRLPSRLVRSAIDTLLRRHEALEQTLTMAQDAIRTRDEELAAIATDLAALPDVALPMELPEALAMARSLGDVTAQRQRLVSQVDRLTREFDGASLELGEWRADPERLRSLALPAQEEVADCILRRAGFEAKALSNMK